QSRGTHLRDLSRARAAPRGARGGRRTSGSLGVSACRHAAHPPPAQVRADREAARELPAAARAVATPYALEPPDETERRTRVERLKRLLGERIVLLDGAMGTMIQGHKLDERGFRGERLREHGRDLRGNNDILTLTRPQIITDIHRAYLAAGADVIDPGHRSVSFDELVAAYLEAARGLLLGGVDLLLIETVFDTLNAKAAIYAAFTLFDETGITLPLALSGTITDASGRLLSGQT